MSLIDASRKTQRSVDLPQRLIPFDTPSPPYSARCSACRSQESRVNIRNHVLQVIPEQNHISAGVGAFISTE